MALLHLTRGLHPHPFPEFPEWYSAHILSKIDDPSIGDHSWRGRGDCLPAETLS